jgi:hypothetical protein
MLSFASPRFYGFFLDVQSLEIGLYSRAHRRLEDVKEGAARLVLELHNYVLRFRRRQIADLEPKL